MRVVFVDNLLLEQRNGTYRFDLQPHLGLISLIAVARDGGHEAMLYDPKLALARDELPLDASLYLVIARKIVDFGPDVVGLTTLGCNFICTVKVAGHVRRMAPDVPILLGGPHATILDHEIVARWPQFDAVVRNEAETTILQILEAARDREFPDIPGVTYRASGEVVANAGAPLVADLDTLPRPAYDSYPIEDLDLPLLRVEAGRGCPFNCTFCSTASFFGRRYRLKSAERLCAELDELHVRYGISRFALTHDLFTVSKAKVREFCDEVRNRGYTWTCSARMDCVDAELLARMAESGCASIYYGVETGSPRMQKIVEKRLDLSLFFPTLQDTDRLGMAATASFITGYPEEELEDQEQTLDLISSCLYESFESLTLQLHLLTPEPGTRLIEEYGGMLAYDGHVSDFNFPTLEADDSAIMHRNPDVFMNHHYYPGRLPRRRHVLVTSVHHALYRLGFPVLRHLLDHYDQRLSRLVAHMLEWAEDAADDGPYDASFVRRFIAETWGPAHHLTSIVRYMFAATELRPGGGGDTPAGRRGDTRYVLSSSAAVLRDLHDCTAILTAIAESAGRAPAQIPPAVTSRLGDYLVVLDRRSKKSLRNFELDRTTADFLEEYGRNGSDDDDDPDVRSFVDELVGLGVLQPAANAAVARAAAAVASGV
jgi:radical SAM superfamily enzyme YgiQ (UPF0313 family)